MLGAELSAAARSLQTAEEREVPPARGAGAEIPIPLAAWRPYKRTEMEPQVSPWMRGDWNGGCPVETREA